MASARQTGGQAIGYFRGSPLKRGRSMPVSAPDKIADGVKGRQRLKDEL